MFYIKVTAEKFQSEREKKGCKKWQG